jgi:hypothetical protein
MSISMSVTTATDQQLASFKGQPDVLAAHVRALALTEDCCYLTDYWDGIHYLLAGGAAAGNLPLAALKRGDISYNASPLESVHGIRSTTACALSAQLNVLAEATLRMRFDMPAMLAAKVYPGRLWLPTTSADSSFAELSFYLNRLRTIVSRAANANLGLIFSRYEDW